MLPIRAFTVPPSLILGFRTISVSHPLLLKKPTLNGMQPPKRPGNAYGQFVQEKYHEITVGDNSKERMKELSRIWKSMSLNEQQPYIDTYQEKKTQFDEDKEKFFAKFSPEEIEKYKKDTKAYKKKVAKRREKVAAIKNGTYNPPPKTVSGYQVFMSEQMHQVEYVDQQTHKKQFSELAAKWKGLSDEEKKRYVDEAESLTNLRVEEYCKKNPEYVPIAKKAQAKKKQSSTKEVSKTIQ